MKKVRIYSFNFSILLFFIMTFSIFLFVILMLIFYNDYQALIYMPVLVYFVIMNLRESFLCALKKETLYVKDGSKTIFKKQNLQKGFEVNYNEINYFKVIKISYDDFVKDNHINNDISNCKNQKNFFEEVEILEIYLKNSDIKYIVLTDYNCKNKNKLINELSKRINN